MTTATAQAPAAAVRAARAAGRRRGRVVVLGLALLALAVAAGSLCVGDYAVAVPDVARTLLGRGDGMEEFVVMRLRLPRLVMAALVGAAFALSGAIFQSVLDNALASPDIIGITWGATFAAVTALVVFGLSGVVVAFSAFGGALLVALAIWLLSWRRGASGHRFVLVGIALAFMMNAAVGYLLTRADIHDAQTAWVWLVGSVSGPGWDEIGTAAAAIALIAPAVAVLAPRLRALQLGDDAATGLGVRAERARLLLLLAAVALAAVGTAAAGPVAFVGFLSAPIARRLVGDGSPALAASALVGVLVVTASDLAAQHLLPGGVQMPVGVVTGAVGAPYLLWLLAVADRGRALA
ncbi:FecCD family ABC transporter permease [Miltoncostaea marina]|uniref:FecCD family ABC transporter permease n=1 Tax=Miltoncostaea marina TaxID=2843215 RepID=UPI001C3E1133|nr:iron chelate uptake ABC transporter family permease subunit [Miltoncostaea marina]